MQVWEDLPLYVIHRLIVYVIDTMGGGEKEDLYWLNNDTVRC